ncbi:MAG: arylsulfatase [Lachnospiraceae bacterium]
MASNKKPNVIIIYADDLGYGDLSCYGAEDVKTPHVDALLEHGCRFDNTYSTSAVCTPARYSLLTGEYPFRNELTVILPGDSQCIIPEDKTTIADVFKRADYRTAVVGKWHLGLSDGSIDWNDTVKHTPNDLGFDYSFIFPATNDRVPCVYMENSKVLNLDPSDPIQVSYGTECPFDTATTYYKNPEKLRMFSSHGHDNSIVNGVGRIGFMTGGTKALWRDEDLADRFLNQVKEFALADEEEPFFVFYALHQPHVPRVPSEKFKGTSKLGVRGDVINELDYCVGELTKALDEKGILEDTIIIFSSDNGPVLDDGYQDQSAKKNAAHRPAGPLRGGKYSKFDGGARVPFIVSWKGHMETSESDALLSQVDLMASFASMLGVPLADDEAVDSYALFDSFVGKSREERDMLVYESMNKAQVLRSGKWAYLSPSAGAPIAWNTGNELGNSLDPQLYNMQYDIGQRANVTHDYAAITKDMADKLQVIKESDHSFVR